MEVFGSSRTRPYLASYQQARSSLGPVRIFLLVRDIDTCLPPCRYWVNVTSVGLTKPDTSPVIYTDKNTFTMPVLIDTGSTLSYFREDLVAKIGQEFSAAIDSSGYYVVDCKYRKMNGTVDFGFNRGKMVISVSYKDFIYEQYTGHCMLGAQPADVGSTNYVLGDTFIRGAYRKLFSHLKAEVLSANMISLQQWSLTSSRI